MMVEKELKKGFKFTDTVQEGRESRSTTYKVVKQYKHHVLCVDSIGRRRCFSNADLLTRGFVVQKMGV